MIARNLAKSFVSRRIRPLVQGIVLIAALAGFGELAHGFALPKPLFVVLVLLLGNFYCGWGCPFGTLQEGLRKIGRGLFGIDLNPPPAVHRYLSLLRYIALPAGLFALWGWLDSRSFFLGMLSGVETAAAGGVALAMVLGLSLFMDRPFCKYLCPFGAMYGLLNLLRLVAVKRGDACVDCGKCTRSCPMGIQVAKVRTVRDPRCINCGECVAGCRVNGALGFEFCRPRWRDFLDLFGRNRNAKQLRATDANSGNKRTA